MNMTLLERARCMLSNSGLNKSFWAKVVGTTFYLVNHSPALRNYQRQIKACKRYDFNDIIFNALQVAEEVDSFKLTSYHEVITRAKFDK